MPVLKDVDMLGIDVDVQVCLADWRELLELETDMDSADCERMMVLKHGPVLVEEAKKSL